jgi:hypothetical protein
MSTFTFRFASSVKTSKHTYTLWLTWLYRRHKSIYVHALSDEAPDALYQTLRVTCSYATAGTYTKLAYKMHKDQVTWSTCLESVPGNQLHFRKFPLLSSVYAEDYWGYTTNTTSFQTMSIPCMSASQATAVIFIYMWDYRCLKRQPHSKPL